MTEQARRITEDIDRLLRSAQGEVFSEATKKGMTKMPKKQMTRQALALMKWRADHTNEDGKVIVPRRPPTQILEDLKKRRQFHVERIADIDKRIHYWDVRANGDKRRELLAKLTTEQLEALVSSLKM